jgi:uncharacterized LabA/DUF88 family protein
MAKPTAIIYVDGLNLYRQCLSGKPELKWLDLQKLFENMLPTHDIKLIRYFTALIKQPIGNPGAPCRQRLYIRALQSQIPKLDLHLGTMRMDTKRYRKIPLELDSVGKPVLVKVQKLEEKGTDVAIASFMVFDAATSPADLHVLVSSDGDFAPTMKLLRKTIHVGTAIISPAEFLPQPLLSAEPHLIRTIHKKVLRNSQMPSSLQDFQGTITRPLEWA